MIEIRKEQPEAAAAVRTVNERAFSQPNEANIADAMILVLDEPVLRGVSGVARYRPEFAEAM